MRRSFDITTAGGLTLGIGAIFGSFLLEGGSIGALILLPAMVIVFGGTFAAAMIGTSLKNFLNAIKTIMLAVFPPKYEVRETINNIVRYSTIARKEGLLALEKELENVTDPFMKKILRFVIDGTEPEILRSLAETEVNYVSERHSQTANIFAKMGGYSPTMGIIGTVMGLIATLAAAGDDANTLIRHIASAFIATLWGVFMANIVWLPIADKLKHIHNEEYLYMDMIVEGILSIQAGEIPSVIRARLNSMLPAGEQELDAK
jgi:chemotaxis protein MotA